MMNKSIFTQGTLKDKSGRIIGIVGIGRDITEKKQPKTG